MHRQKDRKTPSREQFSWLRNFQIEINGQANCQKQQDWRERQDCKALLQIFNPTLNTMTFIEGPWQEKINVTDFVRRNLTSYEGDASFLVGPTDRTKKLWNICLQALEEERANGGVRSLDPNTVSTITSHAAGYIDKDNELIVGLQTDELLRRAIKPFGGIKVVEKACQQQGTEVSPKVKDIFTHYRKTHNDGVFDVYTEEIRKFRSLGFLTGLPDNYARGRIIVFAFEA